MALKSTLTLTTRTADLDSLRHVNNRVYEQFCAEGRYRLLEAQGYALDTLLARPLTLRPLATYVRFSAQQKAGAVVQVETQAHPLGDGLILWDHHLTQPDGTAVCHVQARTQTLDGRQQPVDLWPAGDHSGLKELIEAVPAFASGCERIASTLTANYTDMDVLGALPIAAYWRLFEEARHQFGQQLGLSLEQLVALDSHLFWLGGTYRMYRPIQPGQAVRVHTWIDRIVRVRVFIRQEITSAEGNALLGASREEHLSVALRAARPKAPPAALTERLAPYVEHAPS